MKKIFLPFLALTLLLVSCAPQEEIEPPEEVSDGKGEAETVESDFTFQSETTQENYVLTVLYKGERVGDISLEIPADGYEPFVLEQTDDKAFIGIDPTGLGGYILYRIPTPQVYVYDFNQKTLTKLSVANVADVSSNGNLVAYWSALTINPTALKVFDLSKNEDTGFSWSDWEGTYEQMGDVVFSDDDRFLAWQATDIEDVEGIVTEKAWVLFASFLPDGESRELASSTERNTVDWESNETLKNFWQANQ